MQRTPFVITGVNMNRMKRPSLYGGPQSNINTQIIRFEDVLLMLAESYIETKVIR